VRVETLQLFELVKMAVERGGWVVSFAAYAILASEPGIQIGGRIGCRALSVADRAQCIVDLVEPLSGPVSDERLQAVWLCEVEALLREVSDQQGSARSWPGTLCTAQREPRQQNSGDEEDLKTGRTAIDFILVRPRVASWAAPCFRAPCET
jgi:hypothetical protein